MGLWTTAKLNWWDKGCCDTKYLDKWRDAPVRFDPAEVTATGWRLDQYEVVIGSDESGELFRHAADLLMRYQFYPPNVMRYTSDFSVADRWLEQGDRILQRVRVLHPWGMAVLDVLGLIEVDSVMVEPHRCGFSYVTTAVHVAVGKWSAQVFWRSSGNVVLAVEAVSRPSPQEPAYTHGLMRKLQQRAHRRGIRHFREQLRPLFPGSHQKDAHPSPYTARK